MSEKTKSNQILRLEITKLIRESTIFSGFTTSFYCGLIQLNISKSVLFKDFNDGELKILFGFDKSYWIEANGIATYFKTLEECFRFIIEEVSSYTYHKSQSLLNVHKSINALIYIDFPKGDY